MPVFLGERWSRGGVLKVNPGRGAEENVCNGKVCGLLAIEDVIIRNPRAFICARTCGLEFGVKGSVRDDWPEKMSRSLDTNTR